MKLVISILIGLMFTYVLGFKYVKIEVHNVFDSDCQLQPYEVAYQLSGYCVGGATNLVCNEDGTVIASNTYQIGSDCTGTTIVNTTYENGACNPLKYVFSCVDDYEIPDNTLVSVVTNGKCENDPTWKDDINLIGYEYLDYCIQNYNGAFELTCNSSVAYRNIYNSTTGCDTAPTGYSWFAPNDCSKKSPTFYYCNV
ncbi:hypothetical protein ACTA71_012544 [Dictyostelium dimigraforme]